MKTVKGILSLALILVFALSLAGCAGIIPPAIGESAMSAEADTQAQDAQPAEGGEDAQPTGGEGEQSSEGSGGGESEPVVAPEMTGKVVRRFYHEEMKSTSLGGTELFTAEALLYDELNAENVNGVIHLMSGSSEAYMTFVWTENEDGSLALQTDEFNIYEAKEVEGVLTIVGVRYSLGMMNSGTVDIPLAK